MIFNDIDLRCQQYLTQLYANLPVATASSIFSKQRQPFTETHGEILFPSMTKLLSIMALTNQDVFVDLGSGIGKITAQVFLQSNVKEAMGIEIVPHLHQQALHAATQLRAQPLHAIDFSKRKLTFLGGDFLELPLTMTTVVFINAICFSQTMLLSLGDIINRTTSIRQVITLRPIINLERLPFKKAIHIECSWDSALCYVYHA